MHPARGSDRPPRLPLPGPVRRVVTEHLDLVDRALPGLVEGVYLHGSLGFGEWYDGRSDVDFVAVTSTRVDGPVLATLEAVHRRLGEAFPRPSYDGLYLTWAGREAQLAEEVLAFCDLALADSLALDPTATLHPTSLSGA